MEPPPTCGQGLAEHAAVPAKIGELLASLADNLEAHIPAIDVGDDAGRAEHRAYTSLVAGYRDVARRISEAAAEMASYRNLPMAEHHEAAFEDPGIRDAFRRLVRLEGELAALMHDAHARDRQMLAGMDGD